MQIFANFKQQLNKQIFNCLCRMNGETIGTVLLAALLVILTLFSLNILGIELTTKIVYLDLILLAILFIFLPQKQNEHLPWL